MIFDILNRYGVVLQKQGDIYVGYCILHNDTGRPNFTVYPTTDSFYCFSCHKGGDAIFFVSLIEGITYNEATSLIYDNLNFLIDKLNRVETKLFCNSVFNLQLSNKFRQFLSQHPDKLSEAKELMREVDQALNKDLTLEDGNQLFRLFSSRLDLLAT